MGKINGVEDLLFYVLGGACGLVIFFLKSLLTKLEKGNQTLLNLDVKMAVIMSKLEAYHDRIARLEMDYRKIDEDLCALERQVSAIAGKIRKGE